MFKAASAHSTSPTAAEAAAACIAQVEAAGLDAPQFAVLHANCALSLEDIGRALTARWPGIRLHAATSCLGAMTEAAVAMAPEAGVALLAIQDDAGDYGVAGGDLADGAEAAGRRLARAALADAGRAGEVPTLALVCATPGDEEAFLAGVQAALGPEALVVGGSAADNEIVGRWRVLDGGTARASGAIVSVLFPSVRVGTAFEGGYTPTAHRGVITRVSGRRVHEIDGEPAADVYARWTDGAIRPPAVGQANILMASSLAPLGRVTDTLGDTPIFTLSHPETVSADGSMTLFTRVEAGDELVCMRGTAATLIGQARVVVRSARRLGDFDPAGVSAVLLYYCGGCMLTVQDGLPEIRASLTRETPGVPVLVGFTFGEQAPQALGPTRHGNLMVCAIVFGT